MGTYVDCQYDIIFPDLETAKAAYKELTEASGKEVFDCLDHYEHDLIGHLSEKGYYRFVFQSYFTDHPNAAMLSVSYAGSVSYGSAGDMSEFMEKLANKGPMRVIDKGGDDVSSEPYFYGPDQDYYKALDLIFNLQPVLSRLSLDQKKTLLAAIEQELL